MAIVIAVAATLLLVFQVVLIARAVIDWSSALAGPAGRRSVRGRVTAALWAVTEPVLAPVRRFLPPLRLGTFALDTSFIVVFLIVLLLRRIVLSL